MIRPERPEDYAAAEAMTCRAFWNKYQPGCDEHYLVHKLRNDPAYVPELSRVAVVDGRVVGDVDFEHVKDVAGWMTPVPGGVGRMTITMLLENTLEAAERTLA